MTDELIKLTLSRLNRLDDKVDRLMSNEASITPGLAERQARVDTAVAV
jgi:hypothetical protein